ncbi:hypothetical protein Tco_0508549, partial [Tanacetum coccineum]
ARVQVVVFSGGRLCARVQVVVCEGGVGAMGEGGGGDEYYHRSKTKAIKKESDALGLLKIDDDLFTCDTPLGEICNEFNRLSGMDDDMFTYDVKIQELSYSPCVEQQMDDFENGNLDVYERKMCYDECEKMYTKAVIFINKILVRLIDMTGEQCLYLKYGDHTMVSNEVKESVIATWLIQSYKKQFDEYIEIKKQKETRGDDEEVITDDEPSNLGDGNLIKENEIAQIFRIDTDIFHFETLICEAFKKFNYLLKIDVDVLTDDIPGSRLAMNIKTFGYMNGTRTFHGWLICHDWIMDLGWNLVTILNIFASRFASRMDMLCAPLAIGKWKNIAMVEIYQEIFNDHAGTNNDYETRKDEEWFDEHELIGDDDDDIGDLKDYLTQKDPPYYVNEEEKNPRKEDASYLGFLM